MTGAAPPVAFACPRCSAPASPSNAAQPCARCRGLFVLRAGARLDPSAVPPPFDPRLPRIIVKSAGIVLLKRGMVAPEGVSEGTLDPITGMIPMDQAGVLYPDIFTICVWRKIDVVRLVFALVIPVPISLYLLVMAVAVHPAFAIGAAPFVLSSAYMLYRAVGLKANMVRVAGGSRMITIRFDSPMWRRRRFHDELLRRAGLSPSQIP
jgi:hypothetical protein